MPVLALEQFAAQVATDDDEQWLNGFIEVVQSKVPESMAIGLFVQPFGPARAHLTPLAAAGTVPDLDPAWMVGLPRREGEALLLPLPALAEGVGALWLRVPLEADVVQARLHGWLAILGLGLAQRRQVVATERQRQGLDHFFSMVNHDLKSPLSSIKAMADLVLRKVQRGAIDPCTDWGRADLLERLTFLSRRVKDMANLIDDIGDVSLVERGRLAIWPKPTDLGSVLRAGVERAETESGRRIAIEGDAPLPMMGDARRLSQLFYILLHNALVYSEENSPISVRLTRQGILGQVEIRDRGRGIPEATQALLFHGYGRAVQEQPNGLGIGLYVAGALVAAHGGQIEIESEPGQGTTARVQLPLSVES